MKMNYAISQTIAAPINKGKLWREDRLNCAKPLKNNNNFNLSKIICNASSDKPMMIISKINEQLSFKFPMRLYIDRLDNGFLTIEIPEINMITYGSNKKELKADIVDEIENLWDFYALENDSKLTKNAQKIKKWLLDNIEKNDDIKNR